ELQEKSDALQKVNIFHNRSPAPKLRYDWRHPYSTNTRSPATRSVQRVDTSFNGSLTKGEWDMDGLLRALIRTVRRRLRADEEVTVEAVTKELGYTRQYISGRFHRITGRLLSQFLKEKRLEKAARLLKGGNLRVSQVARCCGFDSENYFRRS